MLGEQNLAKAQNFACRALDLATRAPDSLAMVEANCLLGILHTHQGNYLKALFYCQTCLSGARKHKKWRPGSPGPVPNGKNPGKKWRSMTWRSSIVNKL
ncbi:MAG: tetratricopeptide repeat protein [Bacteroidia bacterium]|nr:tetratricopeptide repeat protein [Bacteroidia bacterium]